MNEWYAAEITRTIVDDEMILKMMAGRLDTRDIQ
jgi:hypothetical protein